jgi:hypothetical protein
MSLSEEFIRGQIKSLEMQRDNAHGTFMQCVGAISILNEQINMIRMQESEQAEEGDLFALDANIIEEKCDGTIDIENAEQAV